MKKILLLFSGILTAFLLAVTASANETHTVSPYRDLIRNYEEAFAVLYQAMADGEKTADLSEYKINTKDIVQLYSDVILASPELFYADNTLSYFYDSRDIVTGVEFRYTMESAKREEAVRMYEREVDYIVSLVEPGLSDAEKALFVHDYLIASYSYDTDIAIFDALTLLRDRRGVCQAYSLVYMAVLRELGMDAAMVTSDEMGHAWNLVEVDGVWYHVDLSFDDPSPDRMGYVLHENFLLDDESIKNTPTPHYGWKSAVRCLSASFKKAIWHGVTSRMICVDGQWYYIDPEEQSLAVSAFDGSGRSDVYRFRERWRTPWSENSYYVGVFSGLSETLGHLFVNTPYEIIIYSPMNGTAGVYLTPELAGDQKIFGSVIYKNTLEYRITDTPESENESVGTFEITGFDEENFGKELPFTDVSRLDPYYPAVKFVYDHGLFRGVSAEKFAPDAYLTRAMFVTVLGRLCGVDESLYPDSTFGDVESGQWYSPYVEWAASAGIVNGVGGNLFDPLGELTHEQMYKIAAMCGAYLGAGTSDISDALILYEDRAQISDWAFESIAYCRVNDLIGEKFEHFIYPDAKSTRAEAADIIRRFAILCGK